MNDNKEKMATTAESVEKNKKEELQKEKVKNTQRTFTRDELNKIINAEKKKQREEILKDIKNTEVINEISITNIIKLKTFQNIKHN